MTRDGLAALALSAYPADIRASHGDEMLATLLDASAGSRRAFARELAGLVRSGLRARATATASAGAPRLIADGICLAAAWLMTLNLAVGLSQRARGMEDALIAPASLAALAVILALALVGHDRIAGLAAIAWTLLRVPAIVDEGHTFAAALSGELVALLCFAVLVLAPRRRTRDLRRLGWLAVPAALAAVFGGDANPVGIALVACVAFGVVLAAAAMLPTDPRLAIAGAIPTSGLGLGIAGHPQTATAAVVLLIAVAPAVLAVTIVRTRRLQRRAYG